MLNNKTFLIYGSNTNLEFYIKRYYAHINKLYAVDIKNNSPFWKQEFLNNVAFVWLEDGLFLFNKNNGYNKKYRLSLNKNRVLFVERIISTGWTSHINSKQVYLLDIRSSSFIRLNNFPYKLYTRTLHTLDNNKILLSDSLKCNYGLYTRLFIIH